jgi:hypothetical protein
MSLNVLPKNLNPIQIKNSKIWSPDPGRKPLQHVRRRNGDAGDL